MDPIRHHEYVVSNNDGRTRAIYINRVGGPGIDDNIEQFRAPLSHKHYYSTTSEELVNNKSSTITYSCICNSNNQMCNGCHTGNIPKPATITERSASDDSWRDDHESSISLNYSVPDVRHNPVYIQTNQSNSSNVNHISSAMTTTNRSSSYRPPSEENIQTQSTTANAAFSSSSVAHLGPSISRKAYRQPEQTDSQYNCKQQPNQTSNQLQSNAIGLYSCKDVYYNESKYSLSTLAEKTSSQRTNFSSLSQHVTICDDHIHHTGSVVNDLASTQRIVQSEQVVNPVNTLAPKEQEPSPNYGRKYPKTYEPIETGQNSTLTHRSLYMATPQFSSEKFQSALGKAGHRFNRESVTQALVYSSNASPTHLRAQGPNIEPVVSRLHDSHLPPRGASYGNHTLSEEFQEVPQTPTQHIVSRQSPYTTIIGHNSGSISYYDQTGQLSKHSGFNVASNLIKLTQSKQPSHYIQYSKSPINLHQSTQYSNHIDNVNYHTQPMSEQCCKDENTVHSYRGISPHGYATNYGKIPSESSSVASHMIQPHIQTATPIMQAQQAQYISKSYNFTKTTKNHPVSNAYYYGSPSPAIATVASLSPQLNHGVYTPTPPPSMQTTPTIVTSPPSLQMARHNLSNFQCRGPNLSLPVTHDLPKSTEACISPVNKLCCVSSTAPPSHNAQLHTMTKFGLPSTNKTVQHSVKKSQTPKPNYRELINELITRNSEEELNMQIIKKTLNVKAQPIVRQHHTAVGMKPSTAKPQRSALIIQHVPPIQSFENASDIPQIKHEVDDKPVTHSPLDLSLRTVKSSADSTEYKHRHINSVDYKHGLPRIDITPNFSAVTAAQRLSTPPFAGKNELGVDTLTSCELPTPSDSINSTTNLNYQRVQQAKGTVSSELNNSMVIKTASRQKEVQLRPSVVEMNPFAKIPSTRQLIVCEQLPPDTSIMALPKATLPQITHRSSSLLVAKPLDKSLFQPVLVETQNNHNFPCDQNLNILGGKRHIQDYSSNTYNNQEPLAKQIRYQSVEPSIRLPAVQATQISQLSKLEYVRAAEIPVIAVNENVLITQTKEDIENSESSTIKSKDYTLPELQSELSGVIVPTKSIFNPESSALTSNIHNIPSTVPLPAQIVKSEQRIRTKAELKGFAFNTPLMVDSPSSISPTVTHIKVEPDAKSEELHSIPGLNEEFNMNNLFDFGWNNTCNNFVEQLRTSNMRQREQPQQQRQHVAVVSNKVSPKVVIKQELSEDDLSVMQIAHKQLGVESTTTSNSMPSHDLEPIGFPQVSTTTTNSSGVNGVQRKLSKFDREKKRFVQEQRIAARLIDDSSSESDNELDKRKNERQKKHLRKSKIRRVMANTDNVQHSSDSRIGSSSSYTSTDLLEGKSSESNDVDEFYKHKATQKTTDESEYDLKSKATDKKMKSVPKTTKSKKESKSQEHKLTAKESAIKTFKVTKSEKESANEFGNEYNMECFNNEVKKSRLTEKINSQGKISLNTMTRSKCKKELEMQLANSKVLRNEKIIRNSTTKIKRKYVRKIFKSKENTTETAGTMSTRLRTKKSNDISLNERKMKQCGKNSTATHDRNGTVKKNITNTQQQNILLEVYRYKRSLKVPPSLITIKHKIAASLPDLERRDLNAELANFSKSNRKLKTISSGIKMLRKSEPKTSPTKPMIAEPKSIIDVLHSRVTGCSTRHNRLSTIKILNQPTITTTHVQNFSETSQNTETTNSVCELPLPSPIKHNEYKEDSKRHFSIFDTKVLQSKTRTESKLQQRREIIREIFVGSDRPASAPPEVTEKGKNSAEGSFCSSDALMSYEKYEQFLEQMNTIIIQNKHKFNHENSTQTLSSIGIKNEEERDDTESTSAIDIDEKTDQHDNNLTKSSAISSLHRRRLRGKYIRRKGSSGFDYIRKKKKPNSSAITQTNGNITSTISGVSNLSSTQIKQERIEDENELDIIKTESDVCREIQKWVLNKGVGQSTMHKAARQGYIDVVVYCLDRMRMNPNQKDNAGYTPLHEACTHGWLEIARILLQFGANHSEAAQAGIRPLHGAIENDHEEVVRLLLSYGADPLLATYSGQTPLMLATSKIMRGILRNHLNDAQGASEDLRPIRFLGPWEIFDATEYGYDIFDNIPNTACDMSRALRNISAVQSNNGQKNKKSNIYKQQNGETTTKTVTKTATTDAICGDKHIRVDGMVEIVIRDESEEDSDASEGGDNIFEFEEADVLLPPLYLLKDEGSDKWVLLSDLCNLLKVKSKDTLLNKICPTSATSTAMSSATQKSLMREFKMSDFLEKATCLQLLCAGEKLNIGASKVVLIKYNESVKNLLGVNTILMKF